MKIVLKNATIVDPKSGFHQQKMDIEITAGVLTQIAPSITVNANDIAVELNNLHVSPGWFDSSVSLGEPGYEERETIANGLRVTAKSGFTGIALQPNTFPVLDNQSQIQFVKNKAQGFATELFPIGAFTKESAGKDMAELFDMKNAGAIAFGDYGKNIDNANILKIGMQYLLDVDALLLVFCQDPFLKGQGIANEGLTATQLGMKGIPNLAEEIQIARALSIAEYTGGRIHIPTVSTTKSVHLIQEAKAKGIRVSCSVSVHHLVLNDNNLTGFDSRFKMSPPLRAEADRLALIEGVLNGSIDCITSDHNPIDIEHKNLEFDLAKDGTIGLESAFGALLTVLPLEVVIDKLTAGKAIFGLESTAIAVGSTAELSLYNPEGNWIFSPEHILSKSKNSAFLGHDMKGKVYGIVNQGQLVV
ncbi:MAG: dihydroorotase [Flavobacterium sp.]|nr:dihydroorotase [Flavobacterium sp.]